MSEHPTLTPRALARRESGAVDGAGTDVCVKCGGPKAAGRINSDKCATCNKPDPIKKAVGRATTISVKFTPSAAMLAEMYAEAERRNMTLAEYVDNGMRRVLKKDTGWVAPTLSNPSD